jgi:hypothetical protein
MLGYDYDIIYKHDKENVVVNALSQQFEEDGSLFVLYFPILGWLKEACQEWLENDTINQLIHGLWEYPNPPKKYT